MLAEADQRQLRRVLTLVQEVLGVDAIAAYLFGSAVLGGLRPTSDLDVFVVAGRRTSVGEKRRLVEGLLAISGPIAPGGRWRPVELTIVVEGDVRPWRYPGRFDFQYGDWLRSEFEAGNLEPWPTTASPDLATLTTLVLLASASQFGPSPAEVLDAVPREDLIGSMVDGMDALRADLEWDTRNVVLTLARIWCTVASGVICPKDAAAAWALSRLPAEHARVLERACAIYVGEHPERWDDLGDRVAPWVDHVVAEIRREARRIR